VPRERHDRARAALAGQVLESQADAYWRIRRLVDAGEYDRAGAFLADLLDSGDLTETGPLRALEAEIGMFQDRQIANETARARLEGALAYRQANPDDLEEFRIRLAEISLEGVEAELADNIRTHLGQVEGAIDDREAERREEAERLQKEAQATSQAVTEVEDLVRAGEYRKARDRIEEFRRDWPVLSNEAEILTRKVDDAAWQAYRDVASEARRLVQQGDLEQAGRRLREIRDSTPVEEIRLEAERALAEIEESIRVRDQDRKAKDLATDREVILESTREAWRLTRQMEIAKAIEKLQVGMENLSGTAYRENFQWRIAHLERIQGVFRKIQDHVKDPASRPLTTWHRNQIWEILEVDEASILIRNAASGVAGFRKLWVQVGWTEIRRICRETDGLTARDHLNLYAFCREFQGPADTHGDSERKDAERLLASEADPEVSRAFADYDEGRF
jgi:hypothetical protein